MEDTNEYKMCFMNFDQCLRDTFGKNDSQCFRIYHTCRSKNEMKTTIMKTIDKTLSIDKNLLQKY